MKRLLFLVLLIMALCGSAQAAKEYTYADLVGRLTDLEALAVLPEPGETCAQFSSYDRASRYDETTGKYVKWEANGDNNGIIRKEGEDQVMAEMEGPGCIWRIWSARPQKGHVRIYLDGKAEPAVDLQFNEYFDLQHPPFIYPALVHYTASGANSYVPIPFQKSCKVVAQDGWGGYYHFTYSTFPKGTIVPTFTRDLDARSRVALAAANRILTEGLGNDPAGTRVSKASTRSTVEGKIGPGTTQELSSIRGTMAITGIKVNIDPDDLKKNPNMLRELVLKIYWDGEKEPSVWCPLGDFFGTAPGLNTYRSLPLGMTSEQFYSYWYMPFSKSAVVQLENQGKQAVKLKTDIICSNVTKNIADLGRFHAKWHRDAFLQSEPERRIDWPMLKVRGRGRYCGVALHVYNPKGGWWGEGDEKFFVDGEKMPSTFGTGSEDYFGYAWCNPKLFQNAFHNQTYQQNGNNSNNCSVNRWHIADNVPFQHSIEADIEKYFSNAKPTLYACTAYWYAEAGSRDLYRPVPVDQRIGYYGQ